MDINPLCAIKDGGTGTWYRQAPVPVRLPVRCTGTIELKTGGVGVGPGLAFKG